MKFTAALEPDAGETLGEMGCAGISISINIFSADDNLDVAQNAAGAALGVASLGAGIQMAKSHQNAGSPLEKRCTVCAHSFHFNGVLYAISPHRAL